MDLSLIAELFDSCIESAGLLQTDEEFAAELRRTKERLQPLRIGQQGRLQEWAADYQEQDVHHRHVSHLVGVYPGRLISEESAPELFRAARTALEIRGTAEQAGAWAGRSACGPVSRTATGPSA